MIKVLIVEDSKVARDLLIHIFSQDPEINVIGAVEDGESALAFLKVKRPDVITMDIHLPKIDGFQVTRTIMETTPVPIIIVSASLHPNDVEKTFCAVEAGALAVLDKPAGINSPRYDANARELIQAVKVMSEVKVVRRWAKHAERHGEPSSVQNGMPSLPQSARIVAIGASTGGPMVLRRIFTALPVTFPLPILVVQHIAPGFLAGMLEWLRQLTALPLHIAEDGLRLQGGHIYFAPDGRHMEVSRDRRIRLTTDQPEYELRPAVSRLFKSVAQAYGQEAIGILLTGMGRDGAAELRLIREAGGTTIVQDKESAVVYGMPGEALNCNAAMHVLSPEKIATALLGMTRPTA